MSWRPRSKTRAGVVEIGERPVDAIMALAADERRGNLRDEQRIARADRRGGRVGGSRPERRDASGGTEWIGAQM